MPRLCATQAGRGSVSGGESKEEGESLGVRRLCHHVVVSVGYQVSHALQPRRRVYTLVVICLFFFASVLQVWGEKALGNQKQHGLHVTKEEELLTFACYIRNVHLESWVFFYGRLICFFLSSVYSRTCWQCGGGARKSHTAGSGKSHPGELEKEKKL